MLEEEQHEVSWYKHPMEGIKLQVPCKKKNKHTLDLV